jgi:VCBS repeat-containing protein
MSKKAGLCLCFCFCFLFPVKSLAAAGPAPIITVQPLDKTAIYGRTAIFTVVATSGTTLSYQWYKDGLLLFDILLAGETSSALTLTNVGNPDVGTYYVQVKNAGGTVTSRHARLTVVNDAPPAANDDSYTTVEDIPLIISAKGILTNDTDADADKLTAQLMSPVTHGSLSLNANGSFTYEPDTDYNGTDSFTYAAHDGVITGNVATVTINIAPVNDQPVSFNDTYATPEDVRLTIPATGILTNDLDAEGDAMSALLVTDVSNGSLSLSSDGSFTYTPNTNYYGNDSFTYRASDGVNPATVLQQNGFGGNKLEIKKDKPGAQSFRNGSAGGPTYTVSKVKLRLSRYSDAPNNSLNFSIGTGINSGSLAGSGFAITMSSITNTSNGSSFQDYEIDYAAPVGPFSAGTTYYLNFANAPNGKEVFVETSGNNAYANGAYYEDGSNSGEDMRFQILGSTNPSTAIVTISVTPVNDAPQVVNDSTNTLEDVSVTIRVLLNDSDEEGTPLTITDTSTANGTAVISGANIVFTPPTNFTGAAVFSYTISDGTDSAVGSVTVIVTPVNDAPVANNDSFSVVKNTPLVIPAAGVLSNDTDVENDTLIALLMAGPAHGSLSLGLDGSFTYTPAENYVGSDSFTYRADDAVATSAETTVSLTIADIPLRIDSGAMTANGFQLKLSGPVVPSYVIEASTNLTNWIPISTNSGVGGDVVFTDFDAANFSPRFYRALVR